MGRPILRYLANLAAAIAPLVTLRLSPLDWFAWAQPDASGIVHAWILSGTKENFDLKVAVLMAIFSVSFICAAEFIDVYLPKQDLDQFRTEYLDNEQRTWAKQLGPHARVNVMYSRRPWYALFLVKRLVWAWGYGYAPESDTHHDEGLCFWWGQGACGDAFRRRKAIFADLRGFKPTGYRRWFFNQFRIGPFKVRATQHVRAVLSVPMFIHRGHRWRCVGVINIDTNDDATAQVLEQRRKDLAQYFSKVGILLAKLRH